MSKITVTTIAGQTSGADANTVKIESGDDFIVDTSVLKVDATNNRVGVGTASPTSDLHVSGGAGAHVAIQSSAGSHWRLGDAVGSSNGIFVVRDHTNSANRIQILADGKTQIAQGITFGSDTAAANTLDDYEEGTWVPVIKDTSGGSAYTYSSHYEFRLPGLTSSTNALPYTKIGNKVFITFSIWWNSAATTRYNINLPFAYDGSEYGLCGHATPYSIATDAGLGILGAGQNGSSFDTFVITSSGGHGGVPYTANSEVYYFINYQTT